jgi:hypothetical protein
MTYFSAYEGKLKRRHYITAARVDTHWFNFYASRVDDYRHEFGKLFCLVVNCSDKTDDAFILPFAEFEDVFSQEMLSGGRWVGTLINDNLSVFCDGKASEERCVSDFHNAFHLLQEAPQPVPQKPYYE